MVLKLARYLKRNVYSQLKRTLIRHSQTELVREKMIKKYFASHHIRKLQIGCGANILHDWLNSDIDPVNKGVLSLDARKKFPFRDSSFDYVFSEHLIEHLEYREGGDMICECYRVLRPGGKIRIATPNLRFLIELYNSERTDLQNRYICWAAETFVPHAVIHRDVFVINNFFRNWGHKFIYDFNTLKHVMESEGFINIERFDPKRSTDTNLKSLESHGRHIGEEFNNLETFVVEGLKPYDGCLKEDED